MRPLIIWGATGQAIVLAEFIDSAGVDLVAFFDNDSRVESPIEGVPIYSGMDGFNQWQKSFSGSDCSFLVAIGGEHGQARLSIAQSLSGAGLTPLSVTHPAAYVAKDADLGVGHQVLMQASIGASSVSGEQCIFNTACSVDHECRIGNGCHVGPGATLAGLVELGDNVFVGAGATVLPRIKIGAGRTLVRAQVGT